MAVILTKSLSKDKKDKLLKKKINKKKHFIIITRKYFHLRQYKKFFSFALMFEKSSLNK